MTVRVSGENSLIAHKRSGQADFLAALVAAGQAWLALLRECPVKRAVQ